MLEVPDIHAIRTMQQREIPKREIARILGISRRTVDKYTAPDFVMEAAPRMQLRGVRRSPKMGRWKPVIDEWLAADEARPRKQRRTARKIYKDLRGEYRDEVDVAEVSVRRYVAARKQARV